MRKIAFATIAALGIATLAAPAADARPGMRGGSYAGGHARRGGIGTGAAVGLGIAGLAAGGIAAGAYGNRYDRPVGYDDGYGRRGYNDGYGRGGYGYGGGYGRGY
ncbi:hypothetical protein [Methylobacterium brachythecii]|uniref:Transmembrane protein n=1 Tax=Methylobacterium brachythecii TaxID=1176177 RepID=A0A7W6AFM2_9HYPH|nr:hypothetical protein [Methylobacterium brachythecii]MBB3900585.1 hypothetical protein [Methylobacterium brachythecii]GLS43462.1 hypothetical protein GCM10007884_14470 [Methylobacterium brachythecii]